MKRKITLPQADMQYLGCEIKDNELVLQVFAPGENGLQAIREVEIEVPDNAPDKIRYEYTHDVEYAVKKILDEALESIGPNPKLTEEQREKYGYLLDELRIAVKEGEGEKRIAKELLESTPCPGKLTEEQREKYGYLLDELRAAVEKGEERKRYGLISRLKKEILEETDPNPVLTEEKRKRFGYLYADKDLEAAVIRGEARNGRLAVSHETRQITQGPEQGYEEQREVYFAVVKMGPEDYAIVDIVNPFDAKPYLPEFRFLESISLEEAIKTADSMIDAKGKRTFEDENNRYDKEIDELAKKYEGDE